MLFLWHPEIKLLSNNMSPAIVFFYFGSKSLKGISLFCYVDSLTRSSIDSRLYNGLIGGAVVVVMMIAGSGFSVTDITAPTQPGFSSIQVIEDVMELIPFCFGVVTLLLFHKSKSRLAEYYSSSAHVVPYIAGFLVYSFVIFWAWRLWGRIAISTLFDVISQDFIYVLNIANHYIGAGLILILYFYMSSETHKKLSGVFWSDRLVSQTIDAEMQDASEVISQGITAKRLHLVHEITIDQFSEAVGLDARCVSQVLNSKFGVNFFHFINNHRVEEAKRLLVGDTEYTISGVWRKSGFNSKASFNRVFKEKTGLTPSDFKRNGSGVTT